MPRDVALHFGHCFRKTGATGTVGHRGTEQEFVYRIGTKMASFLNKRGVDTVMVLADDFIPPCRVFVALHQNGGPPNARGASVGYPAASDKALGDIWRALYSLAGWPS